MLKDQTREKRKTRRDKSCRTGNVYIIGFKERQLQTETSCCRRLAVLWEFVPDTGRIETERWLSIFSFDSGEVEQT